MILCLWVILRLPLSPILSAAQSGNDFGTPARTLSPPRDTAMNQEPIDAALPPGQVPTLRVATPDPRDAKRHIRIQSGWTHYHVAACLVDLPKTCSETGSAPVDDIECPRCRQTPEFARAVEQARNPGTVRRSTQAAGEAAPQPPPRTTQPKTPARPTKKTARSKAAGQPPASPQGSLF